VHDHNVVKLNQVWTSVLVYFTRHRSISLASSKLSLDTNLACICFTDNDIGNGLLADRTTPIVAVCNHLHTYVTTCGLLPIALTHWHAPDGMEWCCNTSMNTSPTPGKSLMPAEVCRCFTTCLFCINFTTVHTAWHNYDKLYCSDIYHEVYLRSLTFSTSIISGSHFCVLMRKPRDTIWNHWYPLHGKTLLRANTRHNILWDMLLLHIQN